jgi:hypothetical protein
MISVMTVLVHCSLLRDVTIEDDGFLVFGLLLQGSL